MVASRGYDPVCFARFQVSVAAPPAEACGSVNIRSSAPTVKARRSSAFSQLGNVTRSTRKTKLVGLVDHVGTEMGETLAHDRLVLVG
jgi:hypothetical protein